MLRYRTPFVRSLVLVWLATWVLADPLFLIQALLYPEEYSSAHSVIRKEPVGTHVTQHHSEVLISSAAEGNSNRSQDTQSDELTSGDRSDISRSDHVRLVALTVVLPQCQSCSASVPPRAPPSA